MFYSTILWQELSSAVANMALASALAVGGVASPGAQAVSEPANGDLALEGIADELEVFIPHMEILGEDEYLVFEFPEEKQVKPRVVAYVPRPQVQLPASQMDGWFAQYGNEYGVDPEKLRTIAYCESHYNPGAVNGPYLGMYQYVASTWTSTRAAMGLNGDPALRANAEESIRTTAWKIAHGGIGAWPVCGKR